MRTKKQLPSAGICTILKRNASSSLSRLLYCARTRQMTGELSRTGDMWRVLSNWLGRAVPAPPGTARCTARCIRHLKAFNASAATAAGGRPPPTPLRWQSGERSDPLVRRSKLHPCAGPRTVSRDSVMRPPSKGTPLEVCENHSYTVTRRDCCLFCHTCESRCDLGASEPHQDAISDSRAGLFAQQTALKDS